MKTIRSIFPKHAQALLAVAMATLTFSLRAAPFQSFQSYAVTNLVSALPGASTNNDPNLLNPWGLTFDGAGDLIVADNADSLATFYLPDGTLIPFSINGGTSPTGVEYNSFTNDFKFGRPTNMSPAQ